MRKTVVASLLTAVAVLAFTASAIAGLPDPKNPEIKVPKSLGGVELGMNIRDADKAWGKTGKCDFGDAFQICQYQKGDSFEPGYAEISSEKRSKVASARILAGSKEGKYNFKGPLMKFETKDGLGLGDKESKIKKLYPKAKNLGAGAYSVLGKGKSGMLFSTSEGRIFQILISDGTQG